MSKYDGPLPEVPVPVELFGKDHWTTFMYLETRCVDYSGKIDDKHMRSGPEFPTRLNDGTFVQEHDDWNCLEDCHDAGLLDLTESPKIQLTVYGWQIASRLRQWRASGKPVAEFKVGS
jgi:hypothetical protein